MNFDFIWSIESIGLLVLVLSYFVFLKHYWEIKHLNKKVLNLENEIKSLKNKNKVIEHNINNL